MVQEPLSLEVVCEVYKVTYKPNLFNKSIQIIIECNRKEIGE